MPASAGTRPRPGPACEQPSGKQRAEEITGIQLPCPADKVRWGAPLGNVPGPQDRACVPSLCG